MQPDYSYFGPIYTDSWMVQRDAYGIQNRKIVNDPGFNETNPDPKELAPVLSLLYPAASRNPANNPVGGQGVYVNLQILILIQVAPIPNFQNLTTLTFEYQVFFPTGFDFVLGGKLPGLYGGRQSCSGGTTALDCFSTRTMWRDGGQGEVYLYLDKKAQVADFCTRLNNTFCNPQYGVSGMLAITDLKYQLHGVLGFTRLAIGILCDKR